MELKDFLEKYSTNQYGLNRVKKTIEKASLMDAGVIKLKEQLEKVTKWISVDEALPKNAYPVITKIEFKDEEGNIMLDETTYSIAGYEDTIKQWIKEIHYYFPDEIYNPTHWRPIELN